MVLYLSESSERHKYLSEFCWKANWSILKSQLCMIFKGDFLEYILKFNLDLCSQVLDFMKNELKLHRVRQIMQILMSLQLSLEKADPDLINGFGLLFKMFIKVNLFHFFVVVIVIWRASFFSKKSFSKVNHVLFSFQREFTLTCSSIILFRFESTKWSYIADHYECPKGWVRFQDSCFFFSKTRATWASSSVSTVNVFKVARTKFSANLTD